MDVFGVVAGLLGGLALFLFGVERISRALLAVGGDNIRNILERLSKNAVCGALTGVFVTAIRPARDRKIHDATCHNRPLAWSICALDLFNFGFAMGS